MKNLIIFGIFILALILVQFAQAQTVDSIIDKHIAAMGGKEKLLSLKTVRMEGSMSVQGTDVSLVFTKSHLIGMRVDITVMNTENYQVVTPTKGWVFMPIQGQAAPQEMTDEQFNGAVTQLDLQGTFVDYKTKGTQVELVGKVTEDGAECYKMHVTYKNGIAATYFIDAKTYFITKTVSKRNVNGESMDVAVTNSNYKQNTDGYWFPYTSTSMQGEMNFEKIESNVKVDEAIFKVN